MCHSKLFTYEYTAAFVLSFLFHLSLLYCHYCSVMHVTVMPVSALAFVFGFLNSFRAVVHNYVHVQNYAFCCSVAANHAATFQTMNIY